MKKLQHEKCATGEDTQKKKGAASKELNTEKEMRHEKCAP